VWVTVYTEGCLTREQLLREVEKADILWVGLNHQINADVLTRAKHLKVIVSPTTGLDHIDGVTASSRNVDILSLNGETEFLQTVWATAEHTVALMLCIMRRVHAANRHTVSGGWKRDDYVGEELHGKTVGIVGYGRIGNMVRKLLSPFGVTILVKDRGRQGGDTRLNDLLAASHVVTLDSLAGCGGVPISSIRPEGSRLTSKLWYDSWNRANWRERLWMLSATRLRDDSIPLSSIEDYYRSMLTSIPGNSS
jgi:phosphoglycerate dehydrogenase-like enzyme